MVILWLPNILVIKNFITPYFSFQNFMTPSIFGTPIPKNMTASNPSKKIDVGLPSSFPNPSADSYNPKHRELLRKVSLSVVLDRIGRARNTTCGMFWR